MVNLTPVRVHLRSITFEAREHLEAFDVNTVPAPD
jgi:hypothetical protein